jgi:hypothetical protein
MPPDLWDGRERRKERREVIENFQPQTPFEGYMKAKIESIEDRYITLNCAAHVERITTLETDVANIKGKATILGVAAGFISGFLTKLFIK